MPTKLPQLIKDFTEDISGVASRYNAGGMQVGNWYEEMAKLIAQYTIAAYTNGRRQGWAELPETERDQVWALIEHQLGFLETFADQLETRYVDKPAALEARMKLYAPSIKGAWWEAETYGLPLPAQPGDGTSQCLGHCHCQWRIEPVADGSYDCYWELGVGEEHCQTCVARAARWNPLRIRDGVLVATKSWEPAVTNLTFKKWSDAARKAALEARRRNAKKKVKSGGGAAGGPLGISADDYHFMKKSLMFTKVSHKLNQLESKISKQGGPLAVPESKIKAAKTKLLKEIDLAKAKYEAGVANYKNILASYPDSQWHKSMLADAEAKVKGFDLAKEHVQAIGPQPKPKATKAAVPKVPSTGGPKASGGDVTALHKKLTDLEFAKANAKTNPAKYYYNKKIKETKAAIEAAKAGPTVTPTLGPVTGSGSKQKGASKYPTLDAYKKGTLTKEQALGQLKEDIAKAKAAGDKTTAVTLTSSYYAIKGKGNAPVPSPGTTAVIQNAKAVGGGKPSVLPIGAGTVAPPKSLATGTADAAKLYQQWSEKKLSYYSYQKKINNLAAQHGVDKQQLHEAGKAEHKALKAGKPSTIPGGPPAPSPVGSTPKPVGGGPGYHTASAKEWYNKYMAGDISQKEYYDQFGALAKGKGLSVPQLYQEAGIHPPTWTQQSLAAQIHAVKHPPPPPPPPPPNFTVHTSPSGEKYTAFAGNHAIAKNHEMGKPWAASLTGAEKDSIGVYTGSGYAGINNYLRTGHGGGAKVKEHVQNLDSALAKGGATEPIRVFRGFDSANLRNLMASGKDLNGTTFRDKAYGSTSMDKDHAFNKPIRFNINVPKGGHGAAVMPISSVPHEVEWLMPRNATYVIRSYKQVKLSTGGNYWEVEVDYVGPTSSAAHVE